MRCLAGLTENGVHVSLSGLGGREVAALAGALTLENALTAKQASPPPSKDGWQPLFVRELLRLLDGQGAVDTLGGRSPPLVPSSVRAVVAQRASPGSRRGRTGCCVPPRSSARRSTSARLTSLVEGARDER